MPDSTQLVRGTEVGAARRLDSLTALRFIAAFVVFGYHGTVLLTGNAAEISAVIFGSGQSGVSFFFILSGFVLAWAVRNSDSPGAFYWRRFSRIYPAYFVTLAFGFFVILLTGADKPRSVFAPLFMIQAWVPNPQVVLAVNVPAWSLSCETFFYAVFPLFVLAIRNLSRRSKLVFGVSLLVAVFVFAFVGQSIATQDPAEFLSEWIVIFFPVARLPEFLLGAILGFLLRDGQISSRVPFWPTVVLALCAFAWGALNPTLFRIAAVPVIPFLLLICATAQWEISSEDGNRIRSRLPVVLGEWSYAFYLVHVFCIGAIHTFAEKLGIADSADGLFTWIAVLSISVVAAGCLHRFVERPANRLLARFYDRRQQRRV